MKRYATFIWEEGGWMWDWDEQSTLDELLYPPKDTGKMLMGYPMLEDIHPEGAINVDRTWLEMEDIFPMDDSSDRGRATYQLQNEVVEGTRWILLYEIFDDSYDGPDGHEYGYHVEWDLLHISQPPDAREQIIALCEQMVRIGFCWCGDYKGESELAHRWQACEGHARVYHNRSTYLNEHPNPKRVKLLGQLAKHYGKERHRDWESIFFISDENLEENYFYLERKYLA